MLQAKKIAESVEQKMVFPRKYPGDENAENASNPRNQT